jgi:hypothetical protein
VLRLYEAASARSPGSVVRTLAQLRFAFRRWRLLEGGSRGVAAQVLLFRERKGQRRVRAYLIWRDNALWEAGLEPGDEAAAESLLAYLRDRRKEALEKDKARTNVLPISHLGLLEMTRQRVEESLLSTVYMDCPYCRGHGKVMSTVSMSVEIQRRITQTMRKHAQRGELHQRACQIAEPRATVGGGVQRNSGVRPVS